MKSVIYTFAVGCLVMACGGSPKTVNSPPPPKSDPIPKTAGASCKAVGEAVANHENVPPDMADMRPKIASLVETKCSEDKWSDEARSCFASAQSDAEFEACASSKLTPEQTKSIEAAASAMGGAKDVGAKDAGAKDVKTDAAATPPKPKKATRGGTVKDNGADPCQGGQ